VISLASSQWSKRMISGLTPLPRQHALVGGTPEKDRGARLRSLSVARQLSLSRSPERARVARSLSWTRSWKLSWADQPRLNSLPSACPRKVPYLEQGA
jgi:hypothetical protein